jgi:hypothetical protein
MTPDTEVNFNSTKSIVTNTLISPDVTGNPSRKRTLYNRRIVQIQHQSSEHQLLFACRCDRNQKELYNKLPKPKDLDHSQERKNLGGIVAKMFDIIDELKAVDN